MSRFPRFVVRKLLHRDPFQPTSKPLIFSNFQTRREPTNPFISEPSLPKILHFYKVPASPSPCFSPPIVRNCVSQFKKYQNSRKFSSDFDHGKEVDEINLKFAEAREEIEMALESKETVYFDDEAESARAAVKVCLDMYEELLAKLPEGQRAALQRSMGLKIEQLKAELAQLNE